MDLRLTEKHFAYGEAGLVFPSEQMKYAHWSDRPLFEPVERPDDFTCIDVRLNNREFKYLTFSTQELLRVIAMYMEPANKRCINWLSVTAEVPSINHENMLKAMIEICTMFDFNSHVTDHFWKFDFLH